MKFLSKTKTTYILRNSHLIRYRNEGKNKCARCKVDFIENDIVASTTKRNLYCYDCATQINLVTGNLDEDLNYDILLPNSIDCAIHILEKINADKKIQRITLEIIHTLYRERKLFTKNISSLAAGVVFLVCKLQKCNNLELVCKMSRLEAQTLKRSSSMVLKSLSDSSIISISESILSVKPK
ncbi:MAG: cyclin family protein [Nitrosopumilus sp.]|uniref:cyclin family protein n=1 Tax=Nitrosopumilus sp. TaxID=2024843 RepID=UPI002930289B|nr:cyclin family protein [Nitrosopumilus sp.]